MAGISQDSGNVSADRREFVAPSRSTTACARARHWSEPPMIRDPRTMSRCGRIASTPTRCKRERCVAVHIVRGALQGVVPWTPHAAHGAIGLRGVCTAQAE
jgi:hypothetical protein